MKILGTFVIFLLTLFLIGINTTKTRSRSHSRFGSGVFSLGLSKLRNENHLKSGIKLYSTLNSKKKNKKIKLLPGKLYFKGWLRFYKYSGGNQLRPNHFFTNPEYNKQVVTKSDLKKKDSVGYLNIKDKFAFYALLTKDQLSILTTRNPLPHGNLNHVVDNLQIKFIKPIKKENRNRSSVNDIGNFKEGKCLQVYTRRPIRPDLQFNMKNSKAKDENWIFCFDNVKNKSKLITYLILLKENQQKEQKKLAASKKPSIKDLLNKKTKSIEKRKDSKPKDGYWILLQDWTSCSLKCGGGKSYQQWMCVPPKKGGRKCKGMSIRTRPCNTQPCPVTKTNKTKAVVKGNTVNAVNTPIVRSQPFSMRPQNYMKCEIKENDVFYINRKVNKKLKIPSRIVLNTRTISVFTDELFKNNVFSFNLKETEFTPYSKDKCCFNLESGSDIFTICGGFGQRCGGGREKYSFTDSWRKDFNLFKFGCFKKFERESWLAAQAKKAADEARAAAGIANLDDRANLIKNKMKKKEVDIMAGKLSSTQAMAMKAIKREFDLEKMLTSEIQLKSEMETKELLKKKKREEKKRECLEKAFSAKKAEAERTRQTKSALEKLKSIKNEAKKQILKKRAKMRNKIKDLLNKSKRRRREIEGEIRVIRSKIAKKLVSADHKGSSSVCVEGMDSATKRVDYCKKEIVDSFIKYNDCVQKANYGNICCENEFGDMHIDLRDKCMNLCDKKLTKDLEDGEFK